MSAYRHIGYDGHLTKIPDVLVEAQLSAYDKAAHASNVPSSEVSLAAIARRIGRIELVLTAIANTMCSRDKRAAEEEDAAIREFIAALKKVDPKVTFSFMEDLR